MPTGKNMFDSRARNITIFIWDAHSMKARYRPEYSRIIASWIIVSSRCVAGLSTGILPVSAMVTMNSPENARRWAGFNIAAGVDDSLCHDDAQVRRAGRHRDREDRKHHRRLDDRRDRHLPAGAEPAERAPRIEPDERKEEPPSAKR